MQQQILPLIIAFILGATAFTRAQTPTPTPTPTSSRRFEHRCESVAGGQFTKVAQGFGNAGWELATLTSFEQPKGSLQVYPFNVDVMFVMCFKREFQTY